MGYLINMKKLSLTLVIISVIINGFCQDSGSVEGFVYDSVENQCVAFFNICIPNTLIGTSTDTSGRFIINNIEVGEYDFKFSLLGYGCPIVRKLRIYKDSTVFIEVITGKCKYDVLGKPSCPICKKIDQVVPVVYGEPTNKLLRKDKKGIIVYGGYTITNCFPHWYCKRDKIKF